jgi:hypothetical protein
MAAAAALGNALAVSATAARIWNEAEPVIRGFLGY